MEKLTKLWETQKTICIILGIILLPITLMIFGTKLYMLYNEFMARKSLEGAQKKDDSLKAQEDALKKAADKTLSDANKAAQSIEDRHKDGATDMDWNKKRND